MKNLTKTTTDIDGVFTIARKMHADERGAFERLYCQKELLSFGVEKPIKQMNLSNTSKKGVIRGLHFQGKPSQELKIITCLKGSIFDVAVDLRKESSSYLESFSTILSGENKTSLVIPEGCAHGFQTLSNDCQLLYLHTASYDPENEYGVNPLDSMLNIRWPIKVTAISKKDKNLPFI